MGLVYTRGESSEQNKSKCEIFSKNEVRKDFPDSSTGCVFFMVLNYVMQQNYSYNTNFQLSLNKMHSEGRK